MPFIERSFDTELMSSSRVMKVVYDGEVLGKHHKQDREDPDCDGQTILHSPEFY